MRKIKRLQHKIVGVFFITTLVFQCMANIVRELTLGDNFEGESWQTNHMIMSDWDKVYIGAVNRIYELDSNLVVETEVQTGPVLDSPKCLPPPNDCTHQRTLTDNHNKLLLLYSGAKEKLITCGSIYQGACEARNLNNISRASEYYTSITGSVSDFAVVANSPDASTVAFIAPGPSDLMTDVLYVATTYTGTGEDEIIKRIRDTVPAICSRSLSRNRFSFAKTTDSIQGKFSGMFIKKDVRSSYLIKYITGFTYDAFSYFITQQPEGPSANGLRKTMSKIIQICQEDSYFYSYVDMPFQCRTNSKEYNLLRAARLIQPSKNLRLTFGLRNTEDEILVGIFTTDEKANDTDSAICMFTMQNIRQRLLDNIKLCYQGQDISGGGYLDQKQCPNLDRVFREMDYLCNKDLEAIGNIVGTIPVVAKPVLEYQGTILTSVALTTTTDHTVAIVGTASGYLKKIILQTHERAKEYEQVLIDPNSPINPDIHLDRSGQHLFLMSKRKVVKVKLTSCEDHLSCSSCLQAGDPFCGWCVLDNRCVKSEFCPVSSSDRWLFGPPDQTCVAITDVSPRTVSVSHIADLYLTIYSLPEGSDYTCVFQELGMVSRASRWSYGVHCRTPDLSRLSFSILGSQAMTVALNSSETGKIFIAQNFTYFNCSSFTSCSQCTDNSWSCGWCIYDNKCVHESSSCYQDIVLSRSRTSAESGMRGPLHCPGIDHEATGTIYVPEGVEKAVTIQGHNLPRPGAHGYRCIVQVGLAKYESNGTLSHGDIICFLKKMMIPSSHTEGKYEAKISMFWGNSFKLEDNNDLRVTIYKCEVLAQGECGLCHSINYTNPELDCVWCDEDCKYETFCHKMTSSNPCPAPQIQTVYPLTGPIGGGTLVNISGKDLGSKFEEIQNSVTIAGIRCAPLRDKYQPSQWIICKLGPSSSTTSGVISVTLPNREIVHFRDRFRYQDPVISSIKPSIGPISGGTTITMYGDYLKTGRQITASVGNIECMVMRELVTDRIVYCETKPTGQPYLKPESFTMYFDGYEVKNTKVTFQYLPDPTISYITPRRSFISGGRRLTVIGTNLHGVQQPKIFAFYQNQNGQTVTTEETLCQAINKSAMVCASPALSKEILLAHYLWVGHASHMEVDVGFIMDNVQSVHNMSGKLASRLEYYPDPVVYNFTEPNGIKKFKGEVLVFECRGLNLAASEEDVEVFIGRKLCNMTNLSSTQIFCMPPPDQPHGSDEYGADKNALFPHVIVKIGNLEFHVGRLEYERIATLQFPVEYIVGIAAGGGFMLLVILLILIVCRRQSHKAERNYRKMQLLLDNLESNVRNECKQAFAELQTDMTDFTGDLEAGGIPFWDYNTYTFKVLFPGISDHIILHPPMMQFKNGQVRFSEHGLQHFYHLLNTKYFLLMFIRTLEAQKNFSIKDRVNVASLIMVIYQDNLEYATELLKVLLNDLVEKYVHGKHPKLMLRRTESVVEKMLTNWLSLCMYRYLKDYAGSSLYVLYKSIKLQVEKGPVDCLTGDARYTLSEDKLLREKIDPKLLTLNVFNEGETTPCKVLNCDTITQAKEKILDTLYRNIPYSQRPWVFDLDLEWKKGSVPVLLQDEDNSSERVDCWKKLNTLQHYRVHDGADCALIRRYQTIKSPNGSLDTSILSVTSSACILKAECDPGSKYWHLVKHDEIQSKDGGVKMVPEVFLPRLLATKGTLQKYIDDFFRTILNVNPAMPPVIKFLFDYLDAAAVKFNISDPDVLHTWKCNSLPLRFWVNIIKNPDFVFDINKPLIVDSCLSVVAQTFMDSCSTSEHRLGKDSPSNKLLFAKDIPSYRKMVDKYFRDIREMTTVSDQDLNSCLADITRSCPGKFFKSSALIELYNYITKYSGELMEALETDSVAIRLQLSAKLGQTITTMEGPNNKFAFV
ncbi:hypothetical protein ACJMK2_016991 [Sinanodonta woodiana]|uniref:Sema domain-containing protein n=1 Tax=Sinanodonta woodiana TaxID=1069815 RepID=A0ABD3UWJ8_SINWO